jgi:hypothetical protein
MLTSDSKAAEMILNETIDFGLRVSPLSGICTRSRPKTGGSAVLKTETHVKGIGK